MPLPQAHSGVQMSSSGVNDMRRSIFKYSFVPLVFVIAVLVSDAAAFAQTTAFIYQGKLSDGGSPPSGTIIYEMQFKLFDSSSAGLQQPQPTPVTLNFTVAGGNAVSVVNGVFTVSLDFGAGAFPGANRFLEISVRHNSNEAFAPLSPRQPIAPTPYALRSLGSIQADGLSSVCAGCVQDANINSVAGSKVNGTIPLSSIPAGSGSYIQNTTSQQSASNFNISGNGAAGGTLTGNIVNASTQYNLGGDRFASIAGISNTFVGHLAGQNNTGADNSFFGEAAGLVNTTGIANSIFGALAGVRN